MRFLSMADYKKALLRVASKRICFAIEPYAHGLVLLKQAVMTLEIIERRHNEQHFTAARKAYKASEPPIVVRRNQAWF